MKLHFPRYLDHCLFAGLESLHTQRSGRLLKDENHDRLFSIILGFNELQVCTCVERIPFRF